MFGVNILSAYSYMDRMLPPGIGIKYSDIKQLQSINNQEWGIFYFYFLFLFLKCWRCHFKNLFSSRMTATNISNFSFDSACQSSSMHFFLSIVQLFQTTCYLLSWHVCFIHFKLEDFFSWHSWTSAGQ